MFTADSCFRVESANSCFAIRQDGNDVDEFVAGLDHAQSCELLADVTDDTVLEGHTRMVSDSTRDAYLQEMCRTKGCEVIPEEFRGGLASEHCNFKQDACFECASEEECGALVRLARDAIHRSP